jgi:hypothetical protein
VRDLWPDSVRDVEKMNINLFYPVLKFMEKMLYRQSDKIVINNEGFRNYIKKMTKNKSVLFLPNALLKAKWNLNKHLMISE